jgi:hypothetical protein
MVMIHASAVLRLDFRRLTPYGMSPSFLKKCQGLTENQDAPTL